MVSIESFCNLRLLSCRCVGGDTGFYLGVLCGLTRLNCIIARTCKDQS